MDGIEVADEMSEVLVLDVKGEMELEALLERDDTVLVLADEGVVEEGVVEVGPWLLVDRGLGDVGRKPGVEA